MREEVQSALANIAGAVAISKLTKAEHIQLDKDLQVLQKKLAEKSEDANEVPALD